ncbi:MAG TPA: DUF2520 domain-containing protein, partial [Candidatus Binatia bacterium]|nr:DUF2520 domain-containing protein [Candidatus Binatia bacterium]
LSSDELDVLRKQGAAVVAAHPLMTFVRGSRPALAGVPFGVEGDAKAIRTVRAIVRSLGGEPFAIPKSKKAAYHAWGMFTSPLLTALLVAAEEVARRAGIGRKDARRRMLPILKQTLANYERLGAAGSFSGPIPRGDVATIAKHMRILAGKRELREVYLALARAALDLLPATKRAEMKKLLSR